MKNRHELKVGSVLEGLLYLIGYAIVLILVSHLFKTFYLDTSLYGLYPLLAVIIMYALNKTVKPILFYLTLPITGVTLGLFYPVLNLVVLKLTDWILGSHFDLKNIFIAFFIAILISVMNFLMEGLLIKPIIKKVIE